MGGGIGNVIKKHNRLFERMATAVIDGPEKE